MFFIGRKNEIKLITNAIHSNSKELIAIIGKRGIGKTFLMQKIIDNLNNDEIDNNFKILSFEGMRVSRKTLLKDVEEKIEKQLNTVVKINQWEDFFEFLKQQSQNQKTICFIDEFPWFNTKKSDFVERFGRFWNLLNNNNLKIIITGSAVSWMNKNVFRAKGGLYHKTTLKIHLKSFDLLETRDFLKKKNPHINNLKIIEYYLITSGIVRYLQQIDFNKTIEENKKHFFNNIVFDDFFDNCFNSYKNNIHKEIVMLFNNRISLSFKEIKEKLIKKDEKRSDATIYNALKELVETDILFENKPFKSSKRDTKYVLIDSFCFFSLRNNNSFNERILDGLAFEILVYNNIEHFLKKMGRSFSFNAFRFQNKETQIDLAINYYNTNIFSIIECKNYNNTFVIDEATEKNLLKKISVAEKEIKKKKIEIDVIFITIFGVRNLGSLPIHNISIDEFLNE